MRIIAGEMRSRTILAPRGTQTRPTLDRTRESLFNIIAAECPQAQVLDLYAGSGALALEAVSRGARSAVLCDCSREAAKAIRANIESLRVQDKARFLQMSDVQALQLLSQEGARFDLVFLDPPYRLDTAPACALLGDLGLLMDNALVIIEHAAGAVPAPDGRFHLTDQRKYRDTMISFYRYEESGNGGTVGFSGQL